MTHQHEDTSNGVGATHPAIAALLDGTDIQPEDGDTVFDWCIGVSEAVCELSRYAQNAAEHTALEWTNSHIIRLGRAAIGARTSGEAAEADERIHSSHVPELVAVSIRANEDREQHHDLAGLVRAVADRLARNTAGESTTPTRKPTIGPACPKERPRITGVMGDLEHLETVLGVDMIDVMELSTHDLQRAGESLRRYAVNRSLVEVRDAVDALTKRIERLEGR